MKSFGCSDPVILFYVLQLLIQLSCQKATHSSENHVKKLYMSRDKKSGIKNVVEVGVKHKITSLQKKGKTEVEAKNISATIYPNQKKKLPSKEGKSDARHNVSSQKVAKADNNYNHHYALKQRVKNSIQAKNTTNASETRRRFKTASEQENKKGKKQLFKKYGLFRSFPLSQQQSEEYPPVGLGAGLSNEGYAPEAGAVQEGGMGGQDQAPQQEQQLDIGNTLSQYSNSQDNGYQQDNSQSAIASFANSNSDDAAPSDGAQSERLDQALQLQQEAYAQQPREQEQEQGNTAPDNQGGGIESQLGQVMDGGQVPFQPDQGSPARDQGTVVGQDQDQAGEESEYDRNGFHQEQTQEPEQQQQPQDMDQQLPEYGDQQLQQQDQPQEYLPQQQREEQQETEGTRLQTPAITALSNSYGGLFSPESDQPMPGQQGQGITDYASEQPGEGGGKNEPPAPQYTSSLAEALREQAGFQQETNSEEKENQDGIAPDENGNVINIGGAADSNDGRNHEYMGAGALNAPSGFSTAALTENDSNNQLETNPEINGYAPMNNGPNLNNDDSRFTGLDEMQQAPAAPTTDAQGAINYGGPQFGGPQFNGPQFGGSQFSGPQFHQLASGTKIPTAEEEFYKIINIANKNGPTAGNLLNLYSFFFLFKAIIYPSW